MDKRKAYKPNTQILEEASTWFVEFSEGQVSTQDREAFARWLRSSPEHVRAYLQVSAFWEDAPLLNKDCTEDPEALIARVMADSNVVTLEATASLQPNHESVSPTPRSRPTRYAFLIAAALSLAAVGIATWWQLQQGIYSTGIGEQRLITLADGSTVELNAQSRLRVKFTATERTIDLRDGQALFHVAKDPNRPFVVHVDTTRVRAVGTEFDVYRRRSETIVTVVEGRVTLLTGSPNLTPPAPATPQDQDDRINHDKLVHALLLTAGEQVTLTGQSMPRPTRTDLSVATAWTRGKLVFAFSPLTQVAQEYNRYHEKPLIIRDQELASFHVSGVFSATDNAALIAFLQAQPTIVVRETDTEISVTRK